jgi:adenylylsulfate kinase
MNEERGFTLWFTGLSGSGKTTISEIVEHELRERERQVEVLDGDIVRTNLSKGLTFSRDDRNINVLRIGFVANLLTRNGVGVIVSAISPYKEARDQVRRRIVDFVEVFVDAPLEVCAERDVKGLYKKAFAGEIEQFTGVSDPYEPPNAPDLVLKTDEESPEESARRVIEKLEFFGYLWPREAQETEYNWSSRGQRRWEDQVLPNAALVSMSARSGFAFACQHFSSLGTQDRFS